MRRGTRQPVPRIRASGSGSRHQTPGTAAGTAGGGRANRTRGRATASPAPAGDVDATGSAGRTRFAGRPPAPSGTAQGATGLAWWPRVGRQDRHRRADYDPKCCRRTIQRRRRSLPAANATAPASGAHRGLVHREHRLRGRQRLLELISGGLLPTTPGRQQVHNARCRSRPNVAASSAPPSGQPRRFVQVRHRPVRRREARPSPPRSAKPHRHNPAGRPTCFDPVPARPRSPAPSPRSAAANDAPTRPQPRRSQTGVVETRSRALSSAMDGRAFPPCGARDPRHEHGISAQARSSSTTSQPWRGTCATPARMTRCSTREPRQGASGDPT